MVSHKVSIARDRGTIVLDVKTVVAGLRLILVLLESYCPLVVVRAVVANREESGRVALG